MTKPVLTTVTLPDGSKALRTSERYAYTHAVVLAAEDPALLKAHLESVITTGNHDVTKLLEAVQDTKPVIRSRGISTRSTDLDFSGNPTWNLYEAQLVYNPAGNRTRLVTWCNSHGITKDLRPVSETLEALALAQIEQIQADVARADRKLRDLLAGTYELAAPVVVAWSTSRPLAEKAMASKAPYYPTRKASVVPVD